MWTQTLCPHLRLESKWGVHCLVCHSWAWCLFHLGNEEMWDQDAEDIDSSSGSAGNLVSNLSKPINLWIHYFIFKVKGLDQRIFKMTSNLLFLCIYITYIPRMKVLNSIFSLIHIKTYSVKSLKGCFINNKPYSETLWLSLPGFTHWRINQPHPRTFLSCQYETILQRKQHWSRSVTCNLLIFFWPTLNYYSRRNIYLRMGSAFLIFLKQLSFVSDLVQHHCTCPGLMLQNADGAP